MLIIIDILLVIMTLVLLLCFYMLYRNEKTGRFRKGIVEMIFKDNRYPQRLQIFQRVSYDKMLYSMKRLKLENFYTPEEIEQLRN